MSITGHWKINGRRNYCLGDAESRNFWTCCTASTTLIRHCNVDTEQCLKMVQCIVVKNHVNGAFRPPVYRSRFWMTPKAPTIHHWKYLTVVWSVVLLQDPTWGVVGLLSGPILTRWSGILSWRTGQVPWHVDDNDYQNLNKSFSSAHG